MRGGVVTTGTTLLVAAATLLAPACTTDGTHLVAWIESDLQPCTELAAVDVEARWEGGALLGARHLDLCAETLRLPGLVELTPKDPADARRVVVTVSGAVTSPGAAGYRLRQEFVTRFQRGSTVIVRYVLSRVCAADPCPTGFTCVPGAAGAALCVSR